MNIANEKEIKMGKSYSKAAAATFGLNKCEPIHRWYSYLEGYSSCLIDDIVMEIGIEIVIRALRFQMLYARILKNWNLLHTINAFR